MIKRIALYGVLSGTALVWVTGYAVDKAITKAVTCAWVKPTS